RRPLPGIWQEGRTAPPPGPHPSICGAVPSDDIHIEAEAHLATLAELRDKAAAAGKFGDAISAEGNRGKALGYYIERRESGAVGAFKAKTRERKRTSSWRKTIARIAAKQAIEKAKQQKS